MEADRIAKKQLGETEPSEKERLAGLQAENEAIMLAMVESYETQSKVNDAVMLAQAELYEMMLGG